MGTTLGVKLDGDGCWPDLSEKKVIHRQNAEVALLEEGMQSGASSVSIRVDIDEDTVLICETSLKLFLQAAKMMRIADEDNHT